MLDDDVPETKLVPLPSRLLPFLGRSLLFAILLFDRSSTLVGERTVFLLYGHYFGHSFFIYRLDSRTSLLDSAHMDTLRAQTRDLGIDTSPGNQRSCSRRSGYHFAHWHGLDYSVTDASIGLKYISTPSGHCEPENPPLVTNTSNASCQGDDSVAVGARHAHRHTGSTGRGERS
jgi:hypothetical protein